MTTQVHFKGKFFKKKILFWHRAPFCRGITFHTGICLSHIMHYVLLGANTLRDQAEVPKAITVVIGQMLQPEYPK